MVNVSYPGFEERTLPTVNKFIGYPGCYVAAYSRRKEKRVYSVGGDIYVMGQVRVPGSYQERICLPVGYENSVKLEVLLCNVQFFIFKAGKFIGSIAAIFVKLKISQNNIDT